jgi:glyceraldehyde 3-phosphate dehydrogenase
MIPTTTGAAQAAELVLPRLAGRLDGMAIRVPIPNGSVTDLVTGVAADVTPESVLDALGDAAASGMAGILEVSSDELVSIDIVGNRHSAIVDAPSTRVLRDRVVKLLAWYDNEWGYAARLVEIASRLGS